jgi:hypothetical protein
LLSPTKVSSSLNPKEVEQLKCVFCYPIIPIVGQKKGVTNYHFTNGISFIQKHLEDYHHQLWKE